MAKLFYADGPGRDQRQIEARKQQRAAAEKTLRDADEYNAALKLFMVDARLKAIVQAYVVMDEASRDELARLAKIAITAPGGIG